MPGIPALWRQKGHKFKTSLPYIVNSCLRRNTEGVYVCVCVMTFLPQQSWSRLCLSLGDRDLPHSGLSDITACRCLNSDYTTWMGH